MNTLLFKEVLIKSSSEINEIRRNLIQATEPWQNQTKRIHNEFKNDTLLSSSRFEMLLIDNRFTIRRINDRYSRNGFRPVIKGQLQPIGNETAIRLLIRQDSATIAVFVLWTALSLLICFTSSPFNFRQFLTGLLFFTIGYAIFSISYNSELKAYLNFIDKTFQNLSQKTGA